MNKNLQMQFTQLFSILLIITVTFKVNALQTCDNIHRGFSLQKIDEVKLPDSIIASLTQALVVKCVADTHISAGVNAMVKPDFHTGNIHVLLRQGLSGDSLLTALHHELHHALQYFLWMQTPAKDLWAERLTLLAGMMKPGKLNGSFQVRANLKKHPLFKNAPRRWLQAYTNVFFCMEYQAYLAEARYVDATKPDMRLVSEYVRQHLAGETDAISQFLNGDVVKKYWDSEFTQKQLALAEAACPASNNPVDMFRASVKALGING